MTFSKNDQRKVLLIDRDSLKQDLRALALRNCEVEVHTAGNINDASRLWTKYSYDLVLLAAEENSEEAALFCDELRKSKRRQRIALLVGAPQYVREVSSKRMASPLPDTRSTPRLVFNATQAQPTHWRVMIERLLAAG